MKIKWLGIALLACSMWVNASTSVMYLTDGDSSVMHRVDLEAGTALGSDATYRYAYPIAVADTVRLHHRDNAAGAEYSLEGAATGVTWPGGTLISQFLDGTTDGIAYNYAAGCCGISGVYRFDRLWGNAELLFDLGDESGASGITYDPVNNTLWLILFNGSLVQYDMAGNIISSTSAPAGGDLVGLSYQSSSDSFWAYGRASDFYNFDRSGNLIRTLSIPGLATNNVYGGEIAMLPTYTVGGSVSGLTGSGLLLQNNRGDNLSVPANATAFTFAARVAQGGNYEVTVQTQPQGQTCTVTNSMGSNLTANVTNVQVNCANTTPANITAVPTISELGLLSMSLGLGLLGLRRMKRKS